MIYPRHTYIITWNIDHDDYTISDFKAEMRNLKAVVQLYEFRQSLMHPEQGLVRAGDMKASLTNWKEARRGDRFFLYMVSEKEEIKNRIVGSGFFYTEPYLVKRNDEIFSMFDLDFDVMINPDVGYKLLTEEVLELQFPDFDWSGKTPDFVLDTDTAFLMERKWYLYIDHYYWKHRGKTIWTRTDTLELDDMYVWIDYEKGVRDRGRAAAYKGLLYCLKNTVFINTIEEAEEYIKKQRKKYENRNINKTL